MSPPRAVLLGWRRWRQGGRRGQKRTYPTFRHLSDLSPHTVTWSSTPVALDEVDVPGSGTSTAVHFTSPGIYIYSCSIHGATVENGTVRVLVPGS